jgi:hypothetical protein
VLSFLARPAGAGAALRHQYREDHRQIGGRMPVEDEHRLDVAAIHLRG